MEQLIEELLKITDDRAAATKYADQILKDPPDSWNFFANLASERRAKAKSDWRDAVATVGEAATYGPAAAANWTPAGWTAEHEAMEIVSCERAASKANDDLIAAEQTLAQLFSQAHEFSAWEAERKSLNERHTALTDNWNRVDHEARQSLKQAEESEPRITVIRSDRDKAIALLECGLENQSELEGSLREKKIVLGELESRAGKRASEKAEKQAKLDDLHQQIDQAKTEVETIQATDSADCPTCGQPWPEAAQKQAAKIKLAEERCKSLEIDLAKSANRAVDYSNWARKQAEMDQISIDKIKQEMLPIADDLQKIRKDNDHLGNRVNRLKAELREALALAADAVPLGEQAAKLSGEIAELNRRINDHVKQKPQAMPADAIEQAEKAVDSARQALRSAQESERMIKAKANADAAHVRACQWNQLAIFAGDSQQGIRARRLTAELEKISQWVGRVCPWAHISVAPGPALKVRGAMISDCSGGERWAALAALRITVAVMRGAPACVIDGLDVLTETHRHDLLARIAKGAQSANLPVLLTQSIAGQTIGIKVLDHE